MSTMIKTVQEKMFFAPDEVIGTMPKNSQTEYWISKKRTKTARGESKFVEIREMWFKDGPMAEPRHTKKGTMVRRDMIGKCTEFFLMGIDPEDITAEQIDRIRTQLARLEGSVDASDDQATEAIV
jgi:hypothetical protein